MLERDDVVTDFAGVGSRGLCAVGGSQLFLEQIGQTCLGALDARGHDGLLANAGRDEEVRIEQLAAHA